MGTAKENAGVAEEINSGVTGGGDTRRLQDLRGIGPRMLEDFQKLGIGSVRQLRSCEAQSLYDAMCELTGQRQDPCVLDTFRCAIEQARNPNLPAEQREWWYWSRLRLGAKAHEARRARASRTKRSA